MSARKLGAVLALVGAARWLAQTLLLVIRGGVAPHPALEAFTFGAGLLALGAATALIAWALTTTRSRPVRAIIILLSVMALMLALFVGQAVAFTLPGSPWYESDLIVVVIAATALVWGITDLRRRPE